MDLLDRVRATGLLDGPVVVLFSGGRDSTALLDCAARLAPRVRALHVDYGLREDATEHCRSIATRLGVELDVEVARRPDDASGNLHAWARDRRYAAGARLAVEHRAVLAAGHTASDQVETVLYRLATSPGRRAALGMDARSGRLVRPLLGVTRDETRAHCEARGLPFREDPSNSDPAFARTRVRETLLPALEAVDERAVANVLRTIDALRDEAAVLNEVVDTALAGRDHVAVGHLGALPPALARLVLRRLAEDATGAPCPRAAHRRDDVLELGADGSLDLGDGARAAVRDSVLRVVPTPPLPAGMRA